MKELDIRQRIASRRLLAQRLTGGAVESPVEVVDWLLAVQAQDFAGSKWAVGLRMQKATDASIEQAFNEGAILRTHLLRPTWHYVTPTDIRWLLMLTAPRVQAQCAHMYRRLELEPDVRRRATDAMARAVEGGRFATRDEMREVLESAGISTSGLQRMTYLMMNAELEGVLCSGPRRGKQFTYALLDERSDGQVISRDEALVRLTQRFFESRGPATVQDLARWSGLTVADARIGVEDCKAHLQEEKIDGKSYWSGLQQMDEEPRAPKAFLLSVYDEYLSGYRDRSAIIQPEYAARLVSQGSALYYVLVVDTQIVGTWKRTLAKESVRISIELFQPLNKRQKEAVDVAAERYGKFLGRRAVIE